MVTQPVFDKLFAMPFLTDKTSSFVVVASAAVCFFAGLANSIKYKIVLSP